MFPNLEAEQRRQALTNGDMAKILKVSRSTYESKKKKGNFSLSQIVTLCNYFHCKFEYLFELKKIEKSYIPPKNTPI